MNEDTFKKKLKTLSVLRDSKTALVSPFPPYFPQQSFFKCSRRKQEEKKRTLSINDICCKKYLYNEMWMDGQKEKKRRFALPKNGAHPFRGCQQTLSQLKTVSGYTTGCFCCCWFSVSPFKCFWLSWKPAEPGPGLETTAVNTLWFSLNSDPGFPGLPNFNFTFIRIPASKTCQYNHTDSVCTLDKLNMFPNIETTWVYNSKILTK